MIPPETQAAILRYYHAEGWKIGTIATQLGVHHTTVRRVLARAGVPEARHSARASMIDAYLPFVLETLEKFPRLTASRLYGMVQRRGYPGGPDHFRHLVALHRPRPAAEAYLRLRTLPGEQAQVDWGSFGTVAVPGGQRRLSGFVMVLSYSRKIFLRFFYDQHLESFLRGHVEAFELWGGVPRVLLYDNLRSAVLERRGEAIRLHPSLLAFAGHYRYQPRPVAPGRGNEKGRVERAIRYIRTAFFAARRWDDLEDLNAQAHAWCEGPASQRRCPEDRSLPVAEAFERERQRLVELPPDTFATDERVPVSVGKVPYARFDGNDYSVPHERTRRTLTLLADVEHVRLYEGQELLATHARCWGRGQQIEDPEHIAALVQDKRQAHQHRGLDHLSRAVPDSPRLLEHLAARGGNIGSAVAALLRLLYQHGAAELQAAVLEALDKDAPHPHAVRHVLERRERARGTGPRIPVALPDDPRVRELVVHPHELAGYDELSCLLDDTDAEGGSHEPTD